MYLTRTAFLDGEYAVHSSPRSHPEKMHHGKETGFSRPPSGILIRKGKVGAGVRTMSKGDLDKVIRQVRQLVASGGQVPCDRQLLEQFTRAADPAAFAELVARHGGMVMAVCRRVLGDVHDAEDAFQATWLVLARKVTSVHWSDSIAGWLHAVAQRVAAKARGQIARREGRQREYAAMAPSIHSTQQDDLLEVLHAEIARLPEKYRAPLVLCYLEGKTNAEAAALLNCPSGSMSKRLKRARNLLRDGLTRQGRSITSAALPALFETAPAVVSESCKRAAIQAATLVATGKTAATGSATASVAALAEGVLREMSLEKLKLALSATLTLAFLTIGAGFFGFRAFAADKPPGGGKPGKVAARANPKPPAPIAAARTFQSSLAVTVYQIVEGEEPRILGCTGLPGDKPIHIPGGARWYVQPMGGFSIGGGALGMGGGALGFGGGALGMGGGALGMGGGALGFGGGALGMRGGALGFGGGALGFGGGFNLGMGGFNLGAGGLNALGVGGMGGINMGIGGFNLGAGGLNLGMGGLNIGDARIRAGIPVVGLLRNDFAQGLTGEALTKLIAEMKKQAVPGLSVHFLKMGDSDLARLSDVPGLQTLLLSGTQISDEGLARLKDFRSLNFLALEDTGITHKGLAHLKNVKALRTLRLAGKKIDNKAMDALRECSKLTSLRLNRVAVDGYGLCVLRSLTSLHTLELCGPFTDTDLKALKELPHLRTLRLHQTAITYDGLKALKDVKSLRSLTFDSR
jgi:RNA polymerase sigma-70 factor (ECF subfamily)